MVTTEAPRTHTAFRDDLGEAYVMFVVTRDWIRTRKQFRQKMAEGEQKLRDIFYKAWEKLPQGDGSCDGCSGSMKLDFQRDLSKEERYIAVCSFAWCKDTRRDINLVKIDGNGLYDQMVKAFTEPSPRGTYDITIRRVVFYDELPDEPFKAEVAISGG